MAKHFWAVKVYKFFMMHFVSHKLTVKLSRLHNLAIMQYCISKKSQFYSNYSFDLNLVRKNTLDQPQKKINEIFGTKIKYALETGTRNQNSCFKCRNQSRMKLFSASFIRYLLGQSCAHGQQTKNFDSSTHTIERLKMTCL